MRQTRYLALSVQLPGAFALLLCAAYLALTAQQAAIATGLLGAAAGVAGLWLLLLMRA